LRDLPFVGGNEHHLVSVSLDRNDAAFDRRASSIDAADRHPDRRFGRKRLVGQTAGPGIDQVHAIDPRVGGDRLVIDRDPDDERVLDRCFAKRIQIDAEQGERQQQAATAQQHGRQAAQQQRGPARAFRVGRMVSHGCVSECGEERFGKGSRLLPSLLRESVFAGKMA
jgi:hypothetical protein